MSFQKSHLLSVLAGCVVGATLVSGFGCSRGGNALAVVNGETIGLDEFRRYLEYKPDVSVVTPTGAVAAANVAETLGFQGLQDMLRQRLLLQLARDENMFPSDKEVLDELDFQKKRNPNFVRELQARGLDTGEIKENLRIDLAREKLITKGIKVEAAEVDAYIKKNPEEFKEPETCDMQWVVAKTEERKAQVDNELKTGQGFDVVARRYSEYPEAKTSTKFPIRVVKAMPAQIQQVVMNTKEAAISTWLKLEDGWAKFYIEKKTAEKAIEMDDVKKEFVRRQMAIKRGLQANDLDKRLLDKLKEAKIDVKYEALKEAWKTAYDRIKEGTNAASATETGTPTSGKEEEKKAAPK